MSGIDPADVNRLRTRLQERAHTLREEIRSVQQRRSEEPHVEISQAARDLEDDALADLIVDTDLAAVDRDLNELRDVEAALRRISEGTYGICSICGREIGLARLEANPSAALCIEDQSTRERLRVQTPSL